MVLTTNTIVYRGVAMHRFPTPTSVPSAASMIVPLAFMLANSVLLAGCSRDASSIVRDYLNQDSCLDRAKFILDPEANRAALAEHYKDQKDCKKPFESIEADGCAKMNEGDYCSVEVVFGKNKRDYYHFKKTAEGLKLDWRSSVGYNPVSLPFFRTQRLKGTYLFRVWAKLTDYYNFDYDDAEQTHQSIELRDPDGAAITGYIRRDAPTAAALLDVLKDGKEHGVMVELRYPPESKDSSVVGIERFVAERWRQRPEEFEARPAPAPR
ncbi:hypothetical protein [Polyangium fumosum]|uniref:Uncharacterized protein n=1 Tax=Polyangium fumosum TaxID=889272 RepID=A0A4U1J7P6_9BACT|nr:hypothetical protein [Polyangium fumosum]TKD03391.1 hypothetical protein E8A74_25840 [Polyangium fumosum]